MSLWSIVQYYVSEGLSWIGVARYEFEATGRCRFKAAEKIFIAGVDVV